MLEETYKTLKELLPTIRLCLNTKFIKGALRSRRKCHGLKNQLISWKNSKILRASAERYLFKSVIQYNVAGQQVL